MKRQRLILNTKLTDVKLQRVTSQIWAVEEVQKIKKKKKTHTEQLTQNQHFPFQTEDRQWNCRGDWRKHYKNETLKKPFIN